MERRIILAFALSFLVFTLWVRLFPPPEAVPVDDEIGFQPGSETAGVDEGDISVGGPITLHTEKSDEATIPVPDFGDDSPGDTDAGSEVASPAGRLEAVAEQQIVVDTPLYRAEFTNRGARLTSLVLNDYRGSQGGPYQLVVEGPSQASNRYSLDLLVPDESANTQITGALFQPSASSLNLREGQQKELVLEWARGGWEIRKSFAFSGDRYVFDVAVSVRKDGVEMEKAIVLGPGVGDETADSRYVGVDKAVVVRGEDLVFWDASDLDPPVGEGGFDAAGLSSHYFTALVLPDGAPTQVATLSKISWRESEDEKNRDLILAKIDFPAETAQFSVYLGPKKFETLQSLGPGFGNIIEYGDWLKAVAVPLRSALMWVYGFVGNYGWAIVVLTLLINVVLAPIKHYSYVSMKKMQKLSPQTKKIQEKYKKLKATDPKKQEMNKEMMDLYKKHNVSPMSGCLPMLLTIPFFFAFYRLLMASIELRQAPFLGWIQDLSLHDPYFVLPILMGVTQFGMHRMTPNTSMDPTQAKIMSFMPLFITFLLAWAPAGLVLYWFTNNLVSMGQQITTNRWLQSKDDRELAKEKDEKARKRKKKPA